MGNWTPDQEFVDFLGEIVEHMTDPGDQMFGDAIMQEIKSGSQMGQEMYQALYANPDMQIEFQAWKDSR